MIYLKISICNVSGIYLDSKIHLDSKRSKLSDINFLFCFFFNVIRVIIIIIIYFLRSNKVFFNKTLKKITLFSVLLSAATHIAKIGASRNI